MKSQLEVLKACLLRHGVEAVEDFLGYELSGLESADVLDRRMDMAFEQMPDEEFKLFLQKYLSEAVVGNACKKVPATVDDIPQIVVCGLSSEHTLREACPLS